MQKGRSDALRCLLYVAMLSLSVAPYTLPGTAASTPAIASGNVSRTSRSCDVSNADQTCHWNQRCLLRKNPDGRVEAFCECLEGYYQFDVDSCVPRASAMAIDVTIESSHRFEESKGGSVAAGLLIPTFLILIGVVLYFGARRYRWLQRFRQYRQNRYGNVLVTRDDDDDDDDPPIA